MNRKERRAAAKQAGPRPAAAAPEDRLSVGIAHHQAGRLAQAEACYRGILATNPADVNALHLLGVVARQVGQYQAAVDLFSKAISLNNRLPELHSSLGNTLMDLGQIDAAEASYRRALALNPDYAAAHNNLGNALQRRGAFAQAEASYREALRLKADYVEALNNLGVALLEQGKPVEAEACYRKAHAQRPEYADAYSNLGNALYVQGRSAEAEASCRRAIALKPDYAAAHNNLGNALKDQGRLDEAEACYLRALELQPDFAEAHNNLGLTFKSQGRNIEAEAEYRMALELKPDFSDAYVNLGDVLLDRGDVAQALDVARRGLAAGEASEIKGLFTRCIRRAGKGASMLDVDALGENLVRALTEPWGRPSDLAAFACTALKQAPVISHCVRRANEAWPRQLSESELPAEWSTIGGSRLLIALLESTMVCDIELERLLTTVRSALLKRVAATADQSAIDELQLCCSLARQCFINDYVFIASEEELAQSSRLREAIIERVRAGAAIPAIWLAASAAYAPLNALPDAALILDRSWPDALNEVLTQQIREPAEEKKARASIERLTSISDRVSRLVQEQYEENPYPRWVRTAVTAKPTTVDVFMCRHLPHARFQRLGKMDRVAVLIAGCGTGQHSIETAKRYIGVDMLAVDLSATSLCYAQRKSRALGLNRVRYAQADILQLGSIDRTFDLIEAGGVLHHLADPLAGWRVLLSILRPGGIMRVGLYSEIARNQIVAAQKFIAERGYGRTAQDIRQFRQDLLQAEPELGLRIASECRDFFSTSECRDLLFHHQEHRFSLPQISDFLAESGLGFLGFDVEGRVIQQFRQQFPDTEALTDLARWDLFERENPQTFSGMYQFYLQKP